GQVDDGVAAVDRASQAVGVEQVAVDEFGGQPRDPNRARKVADQRAVGEPEFQRQELAQARADEAGGAGDEDPGGRHAVAPIRASQGCAIGVRRAYAVSMTASACSADSPVTKGSRRSRTAPMKSSSCAR